MIIVGAGGLAKEVLEIFHQRNESDQLYFYDDVSSLIPDPLYGQFKVLKDMDAVAKTFSIDNRFIVAIGDPKVRSVLYEQFRNAGGIMVSAISPKAVIGHYGTTISSGSIIMAGTVITNDVKIGISCLINPNCVISHDTSIGDFVDIGPGVNITGKCKVDDHCNIGSGAILLPKIKLEHNVTVGAGAVVTKDISAGQTVAGIPAKQITKNK